MDNTTGCKILDIKNLSTLEFKILINNPEFEHIRTGFLILATMMVLTIIIGNGVVLLLFYQERKQLKIAHKYIISMAMCDILMGFVSVPTQMYMVDHKISASDTSCKYILGIITSLVQTSLWVLIAASIDRYWAVKYPHHYKLKCRNSTANWIIAVSWIIPCSFGLIHVLTAVPPRNYCNALCFMGAETYNKTFFDFLVYGVMPFALTLIVVLYVLIHREMSKLFKSSGFYTQIKSIVFQREDSETNKKIGELKIREVKTTFLLLITVGLAFITFVPGTSLGYIMNWAPNTLEVKALLICYLLLSINSVFNPYIYAFNIRNVRGAALKLLRRTIYCETIDTQVISSTTSGNNTTGNDTSQTKV